MSVMMAVVSGTLTSHFPIPGWLDQSQKNIWMHFNRSWSKNPVKGILRLTFSDVPTKSKDIKRRKKDGRLLKNWSGKKQVKKMPAEWTKLNARGRNSTEVAVALTNPAVMCSILSISKKWFYRTLLAEGKWKLYSWLNPSRTGKRQDSPKKVKC